MSERRGDFDLPDVLPATLMQLYLDDPAAKPDRECAECGLSVPQERFAVCPSCGGRVGWFLWRHRQQLAASAAEVAS